MSFVFKFFGKIHSSFWNRVRCAHLKDVFSEMHIKKIVTVTRFHIRLISKHFQIEHRKCILKFRIKGYLNCRWNHERNIFIYSQTSSNPLNNSKAKSDSELKNTADLIFPKYKQKTRDNLINKYLNF